jgi:hypothetical protein
MTAPRQCRWVLRTHSEQTPLPPGGSQWLGFEGLQPLRLSKWSQVTPPPTHTHTHNTNTMQTMPI